MIILKKMLVPMVGVLMVVLGFPTLAQAECKGMSKSACEKSSQCSYVKGYSTKSGSKISAYCRNKAKKGTAASGSAGSKTKAKGETGKAKDSRTTDKKKASTKKDTKKKDAKKKDSKKKDSKKKDSKKKDVDKKH